MIWKAQIRGLFGNSLTSYIEMRAKQIMTPQNLTKIAWKPKESRLEKWFYSRKMSTFSVRKHLTQYSINEIRSRNRWEPHKPAF